MKKLKALLAVLAISLCVFAQAKSTGLSDSDIKMFCRNFTSIYTELEKIGINLEDTNTFMNNEVNKANATKVLNKNGISGKNAYDKIEAIAFCYAVETYDLTIENDPKTAALMKNLKIDPVAEVRTQINEKDAEIVHNNYEKLDKVYKENFETVTVEDVQENAADYAAILQALQDAAAKNKEKAAASTESAQ